MTRRKRRRLALGLVTAAVLCSALDVRLAIRRYEIPLAPLEAPVRLALITDLHSCRYGEDQRVLLDALEAEEPDALLLGGDIVDDELPTEPAFQFLEEAVRRWPCVYVTGNHEFRSGQAEAFCARIAELGIHVLRGTQITLELNGQPVDLLGLDDPTVGSAYSRQLTELKSRPRTSHTAILLAHRPERYSDYAALGCDLILNGHAHGGQWRIPFLLNGLLAPNQGFFPAYAGGIYRRDGGEVQVVSRGLARESTRIPRIWNRPELVILQLTPA